MKQRNPIETALAVIAVVILTIGCIFCFTGRAETSYSPMESHVNYILEKHNDSCQYEMGECPQVECSHYHN